MRKFFYFLISCDLPPFCEPVGLLGSKIAGFIQCACKSWFFVRLLTVELDYSFGRRYKLFSANVVKEFLSNQSFNHCRGVAQLGLARLLGVQEVAGSNPAAPTKL